MTGPDADVLSNTFSGTPINSLLDSVMESGYGINGNKEQTKHAYVQLGDIFEMCLQFTPQYRKRNWVPISNKLAVDL